MKCVSDVQVGIERFAAERGADDSSAPSLTSTHI
jgi:hypothetical protein